MKHILFLSTAILLAVSLFFTSCDKKTEEVSIVGVWKFQENTVSLEAQGLDAFPDINQKIQNFVVPNTTIESYEFTSDNRIKITDTNGNLTGTYQRSGSTLKIQQGSTSLEYQITELDNSNLKYQFVTEMTITQAIDFAVSQGQLPEEDAASFKTQLNVPPYSLILPKVRIKADLKYSFTKSN